MKKILILMAMALVSFSANAQKAIETSKVTDNISVGVNAGVTTPLDFNEVFPLNTTFGITLQKDLTPTFGFRATGTVGFKFPNGGEVGLFNVGEEGVLPLTATTTFVKTVNVGLDGILNLSNLFNGYDGTPKLFEVSAVGGLGWMHVYDNNNIGNNNFLTAKTGLDFGFNLGRAKAVMLYAEPAVLWNLTANGKPKFNKEHAQLSLSVGVAYRFLTSNGTHNFKLYDIGTMEKINQDLAKRIADLETANARLKAVAPKPMRQAPVAQTSKVVEKTIGGIEVPFAFDSAELSAEAKTILDKIATGSTVIVDGFASAVGTPEYNEKLSAERAENVAMYLRNKGITVKEVNGYGIVKNAANQKAVITIE